MDGISYDMWVCPVGVQCGWYQVCHVGVPCVYCQVSMLNGCIKWVYHVDVSVCWVGVSSEQYQEGAKWAVSGGYVM